MDEYISSLMPHLMMREELRDRREALLRSHGWGTPAVVPLTAEDATTLIAMAERLGDAAEALLKIAPPAEVKDGHFALIEAILAESREVIALSRAKDITPEVMEHGKRAAEADDRAFAILGPHLPG